MAELKRRAFLSALAAVPFLGTGLFQKRTQGFRVDRFVSESTGNILVNDRWPCTFAGHTFSLNDDMGRIRKDEPDYFRHFFVRDVHPYWLHHDEFDDGWHRLVVARPWEVRSVYVHRNDGMRITTPDGTQTFKLDGDVDHVRWGMQWDGEEGERSHRRAGWVPMGPRNGPSDMSWGEQATRYAVRNRS